MSVVEDWRERTLARRKRLGLDVSFKVPVVPLIRVRRATIVARAAPAPVPVKPAPTTDDIANLKRWSLMERAVARKHGVPADYLKDRSRKAELVNARAEFFYVAHVKGWSYPQIGKRVGRDHTTIMHGARKWAVENNLPMP